MFSIILILSFYKAPAFLVLDERRCRLRGKSGLYLRWLLDVYIYIISAQQFICQFNISALLVLSRVYMCLYIWSSLNSQKLYYINSRYINLLYKIHLDLFIICKYNLHDLQKHIVQNPTATSTGSTQCLFIIDSYICIIPK